MASEVKKFLKVAKEKWEIAFQGLGLAVREKRFWLVFVPTFLIFGILLNLLASGTAGLNLLFRTGFSGFWHFIWKALTATFGVGRNFGDFLLTLAILLLQSTLVATIAVVAKHAKDDKIVTPEEAETTRAGAQRSSLVAGLAILGSGCPTCGTALITPVLGMVFSTGGMAVAGLVSGVVTGLAIIVAIFSLRTAGIDAYAAILKVCPRVARKKNSAKKTTEVGSENNKTKEENGKNR